MQAQMFAEGAEALFPGQGKQIVAPFANENKKREREKEKPGQEVEKGA